MGQELTLYLAQPYGTLPVPMRTCNAETILTFRKLLKLLKSHLFDLAFPP